MDKHGTLSEFNQVTRVEMRELFLRKAAAYGPDAIGDTGLYGIAVRMNDKIKRLLHITRTEGVVSDETLEDTLLDLAVYAANGVVYARGKWGDDVGAIERVDEAIGEADRLFHAFNLCTILRTQTRAIAIYTSGEQYVTGYSAETASQDYSTHVCNIKNVWGNYREPSVPFMLDAKHLDQGTARLAATEMHERIVEHVRQAMMTTPKGQRIRL